MSNSGKKKCEVCSVWGSMFGRGQIKNHEAKVISKVTVMFFFGFHSVQYKGMENLLRGLCVRKGPEASLSPSGGWWLSHALSH